VGRLLLYIWYAVYRNKSLIYIKAFKPVNNMLAFRFLTTPVVYSIVSKTVEELELLWKIENPITTGSLGMTQFEMVNIVAAKCHEAFQIG